MVKTVTHFFDPTGRTFEKLASKLCHITFIAETNRSIKVYLLFIRAGLSPKVFERFMSTLTASVRSIFTVIFTV